MSNPINRVSCVLRYHTADLTGFNAMPIIELGEIINYLLDFADFMSTFVLALTSSLYWVDRSIAI